MTEGNIWSRIIKFALPLALGYVFQQFYTTVDSIIIGNFVSKQALAAVGTTTRRTAVFRTVTTIIPRTATTTSASAWLAVSLQKRRWMP